MSTSLYSLGLLLTTSVLAASNDCILAGPGFPSPSQLSSSPLLASAITQIQTALQDEFQSNDTAWTVALFSSKENKTLYEYYHTPTADIGVSTVDQDSVFRIASVSKVFSVWSFLLEVGDERFNEPVTKYLPELANATQPCARGGEVYNDIDRVRWEDITLGELASHAAGIPRDPSAADLVLGLGPQAGVFGFPVLNASSVPACAVSAADNSCTREEIMTYLLTQHPIFPSAHSPAYTNIAYTLLGYAQEAITGVPVSTAITTNILGALNMSHSSYETPPPSGGVIPGSNPAAVAWDLDVGPTAPSGSIYASTADMVKAGQAILQSTLLSPARTRRWLKPLVQTGVLSSAVGAPWEIRYLDSPSGRLDQLYTKQGDLGGYHAALVLDPEHDLGWVVLAAGTSTPKTSAVREAVMNALGDIILPMAEQQAQDEARSNYAGIYTDASTNSSIEITSDPSTAGLTVTRLTSRGVQVVGPESPLISIYGAGSFAKLYPSQLRAVSRATNNGTYTSRVGFRATFFNATEPGKVQDPCLMAWTALGAPVYGQVSLDDWVFEMGEDGVAKGVDVRMLRLKMRK